MRKEVTKYYCSNCGKEITMGNYGERKHLAFSSDNSFVYLRVGEKVIQLDDEIFDTLSCVTEWLVKQYKLLEV